MTTSSVNDILIQQLFQGYSRLIAEFLLAILHVLTQTGRAAVPSRMVLPVDELSLIHVKHLLLFGFMPLMVNQCMNLLLHLAPAQVGDISTRGYCVF